MWPTTNETRVPLLKEFFKRAIGWLLPLRRLFGKVRLGSPKLDLDGVRLVGENPCDSQGERLVGENQGCFGVFSLLNEELKEAPESSQSQGSWFLSSCGGCFWPNFWRPLPPVGHLKWWFRKGIPPKSP